MFEHASMDQRVIAPERAWGRDAFLECRDAKAISSSHTGKISPLWGHMCSIPEASPEKGSQIWTGFRGKVSR